MKYNCLIVDDEGLARAGMEKFVDRVPTLKLVDSCNSAFKAMEVLSTQRIDILFLDIKMPQMSGIEFLKSLHKVPATIITTAFSEYAVESFELDVIYYLVKPISFEKFLKAVNKAIDFSALQNQGKSVAEDHLFIKCQKNYEKILFNDILFVEALQNYVIFRTTHGNYITYLTLKRVGEFLPAESFSKVHKSFIVAHNKIDRIERDQLVIQDYEIKFSSQYKSKIVNSIMGDNLLKRRN